MSNRDVFLLIIYPALLCLAALTPWFLQLYRSRSKKSIRKQLKEMEDQEYGDRKLIAMYLKLIGCLYFIASALLMLDVRPGKNLTSSFLGLCAMFSAALAMGDCWVSKPVGIRQRKERLLKDLQKLEGGEF